MSLYPRRCNLYLLLRCMYGPTVRVFAPTRLFVSFCARVSGSATQCPMSTRHTLNHACRGVCIRPFIRCRRLCCCAADRRRLYRQRDKNLDDAALGQCVLHASQRGRIYEARSDTCFTLGSNANGVLLPQRRRLQVVLVV